MAVTTGMMLALSAGMSVMGQIQQGAAQKRAANEQAQRDEIQAERESVAATQEAKRIRAAGDRTAGAARAQLAASGIDVGSGSAININEDITGNAESDAMNTLLTGSRRAESLRFTAQQTRTAGANAQKASIISAASTGLQGWAGVKAESVNAFADRAGAIGSGSGGRTRTITGGR